MEFIALPHPDALDAALDSAIQHLAFLKEQHAAGSALRALGLDESAVHIAQKIGDVLRGMASDLPPLGKICTSLEVHTVAAAWMSVHLEAAADGEEIMLDPVVDAMQKALPRNTELTSDVVKHILFWSGIALRPVKEEPNFRKSERYSVPLRWKESELRF
jgi:thiamine pyrophosphate-dependent acetolactate synthase large subunit-like protein